MSVPAAYFDGKYEAHPDPWGFESSWYEQRKYALTLSALPCRRYLDALELGCSIGVFTELLAGRCDTLLAVDGAARAVQRTQERCAGLTNVTAEHRMLPDEWPDGSFDLVVMSEIGYYLSARDLARTLERARRSLRDGGHLVAVHWRGEAPEHPLSADEVHRAVRSLPGLSSLGTWAEHDFLLEVCGR